MKLNTDDIQALAQLAQEAALMASEYIQTKARESHTIQLKSGVENLATQVVTAVDIESQRLIIDHLSASLSAYDLGLLTEELPDDGSRFIKDYFWCIDPLDGTLPFTEQKAGYAVSIALIDQDGTPIIAAVADPYHQDHWVAIHGSGVQKNNVPYQFQANTEKLIVQLDRSFLKSDAYEATVNGLEDICSTLGYHDYQIHTGYGAVMNAMTLLESGSGCYVKWPKVNRGGGCIWDYAATRLIYDELDLPVSTASGHLIPLNQKDVYMHAHGVIYTTHRTVHQALIQLGKNKIDKQCSI
ncbi:inositol monophosphatase family protein [Reichenbachiella sp.]|uniref:inositol monophosphatase family protein n=1 Tax=Reichenbachiella sp. TaxID=2184521 RepID=UPI003B5ADD49